MELDRALEIFEYNKDMLTCDMSVSRDPEHQDVSPDYYGKDAEDLYYAIVCVEKYIKNAIPIEWMKKHGSHLVTMPKRKFDSSNMAFLFTLIKDWEDENG